MVLGASLATVAAITFALNNAAYRRGAVTGTVAQGMAISLVLGVGLFAVVGLAIGAWREVPGWRTPAFWLFCAAGVLHFGWGRYCNFRATKAMGANLVGPPQQMSLVVTLALAVAVLGEPLTPLRVFGILLIVIGPLVTLRTGAIGLPAGAEIAFRPNYAEGYTFALLSATGYGVSPILVRFALEGGGLKASVAGGFVAYCAAALVVVPILMRRGTQAVTSVERVPANWFVGSGLLVGLSQMASYAALAVAPVSVVVPIQRLSLVFRVFANALINREHEVLGGRVWVATLLSLAGALALSVSTDFVAENLPVREWLARFR